MNTLNIIYEIHLGTAALYTLISYYICIPIASFFQLFGNYKFRTRSSPFTRCNYATSKLLLQLSLLLH